MVNASLNALVHCISLHQMTDIKTRIVEDFVRILSKARDHFSQDGLQDIFQLALKESSKLELLGYVKQRNPYGEKSFDSDIDPPQLPVPDECCLMFGDKVFTAKKSLLRGSFFDKLFEDAPGCNLIRLPERCEESFRTIYEILSSNDRIKKTLSLMKHLSLEQRTGLISVIKYLGFGNLLYCICIDKSEDVTQYGCVHQPSDSRFKELASSPLVKMTSGFYLSTREGFTLNFGRSRILPELVKIETFHPNNNIPNCNRFTMHVLGYKDQDDPLSIPDPVFNFDKPDVMKAWTTLGSLTCFGADVTLEVHIPNVIVVSHLAIVFRTLDDATGLNLNLTAFRVFGKGCFFL